MHPADRDKAWSDRFIPAICNIVGPRLLVPTSLARDRAEATDLIVLRARDVRVAARVRRAGYAGRYGDQFTLRYRRDSRAPTEFEKIMSGWGDWLFYGHASPHGAWFDRWMIVDLEVFRKSALDFEVKLEHRSNGDGSHFVAYDVGSFPRGVVVERV